MGARQYDPTTGRFLSIDPLFEKFPSQTPYQYAFNNPISFKDPTGYEPEAEQGKEEDRLLSNTFEDVQSLENEIEGRFAEGREWLASSISSLLEWCTYSAATYWERMQAKDIIPGGIGGPASDGPRTGSKTVDPVTGTVTETRVIAVYTTNGFVYVPLTVRYCEGTTEAEVDYQFGDLAYSLSIIASTDKGSAIVSFFAGYGLKIDITMSAQQITDQYYGKEEHGDELCLGVSTWKWAKGSGDGKGNRGFEVGWIYIANDFFDPGGLTLSGGKYEYHDCTNIFGIRFQSGDLNSDFIELWMVMCHEMTHGYDANQSRITGTIWSQDDIESHPFDVFQGIYYHLYSDRVITRFNKHP